MPYVSWIFIVLIISINICAILAIIYTFTFIPPQKHETNVGVLSEFDTNPSSSSRNLLSGNLLGDSNNVPIETLHDLMVFEGTLQDFCIQHEKFTGGVLILGRPWYYSLMSHSIPNQLLYNVLKLSVMKDDKSNYMYHNKFNHVVLNTDLPELQSLDYDTFYYLVYSLGLIFKQTRSILVVSFPSNPSLINSSSIPNRISSLWMKLVSDKIVTWDGLVYTNTQRNIYWISSHLVVLEKSKSMSETVQYICQHVLQSYNLASPHEKYPIYYSTSQEREDEIRVAYQNDFKYKITNITTCIHAIVLKILFDRMQVETEVQQSIPVATLYSFAKQYMLG